MATLLEQLAAELVAKTETKKAKSTPKYVLDVDGRVLQQRPTSKKELKSAVVAITIKNPQAKINVYKLEGPIEVSLPVAGASLAADVEETEGE